MLSRCDLLSGSVTATFAASPLRATVRFDGEGKGFALSGQDDVVPLVVDAHDLAGVRRAAADWAADIGRATGTDAIFGAAGDQAQKALIGTLAKSAAIDRLAKSGKNDGTPIAGKWESYLVQTIQYPMPGVCEALIIAGSDERGTIYGIYDLSQNIRVVPWCWRSDVPVASLLFPPSSRPFRKRIAPRKFL